MTTSDPSRAPSLDSVTVSAAALTDPTAPTATMLVPSSGASVRGNAVVVDASASDNVGVTTVEFRLSGGVYTDEVVATGTLSPYGYLGSWNTTAVPDGTYTLRSAARDAAGNTGLSAAITVKVDNTAVRPRQMHRPGERRVGHVARRWCWTRRRRQHRGHAGRVPSDGRKPVEHPSGHRNQHDLRMDLHVELEHGRGAGLHAPSGSRSTRPATPERAIRSRSESTGRRRRRRSSSRPATAPRSVVTPCWTRASDNVGVTRVEFRATGGSLSNALIGTGTVDTLRMDHDLEHHERRERHVSGQEHRVRRCGEHHDERIEDGDRLELTVSEPMSRP